MTDRYASMQQYRSHKTVRASKITFVGPSPVEGPDRFGVNTEADETFQLLIAQDGKAPQVGDYVVIYEPDGYVSWSPAAAFKSGYLPIGHTQQSDREAFDLLAQAAGEIRQLRREREILGAKVGVMDLFALVLNTRPDYPASVAGVDVAWMIDRKLAAMRQDVGASSIDDPERSRQNQMAYMNAMLNSWGTSRPQRVATE